MSSMNDKSLKPVAVWLYLTAASVFLMAVIGAITRLTESGLSITEWRPITGALPPLSHAEWQRVFDLYRQIPEFRLEHDWMTLADFKKIFFWEWFHRLWGRMIGLIYALPFFWFLSQNRIPQPLKLKFWGVLLLGALQGFLGWYMVKSGLVTRVDVSHYRLAAHLGLAVVIFGCLLWLAFTISLPKKVFSAAGLKIPAVTGLGLIFVTLIYGSFVAGLNAGMIYNSFPMMGKYPWPSEGLYLAPVWLNFFENHATVQFIHRLLAMMTLAAVTWLWLKSRKAALPKRPMRAVNAAMAVACLQVALGIATLLSVVWLPVAVLHQAGALILFAALVWVKYELQKE